MIPLLLLFLIHLITAQVTVLTDKNFNEVVGGKKAVLLEFYAPWCGHCQRLEPIWEELAALYKDSKDVVIAKIDADNAAHKQFASQFGVQGFPTIKFFEKNSKTDPDTYNSGRDIESFKEYINKKVGVKTPFVASDVLILTDQNFDEMFANHSKAGFLVEYYAPWCGHCKALAPIYEKVASAFSAESSVVIAKVDCDANTKSAVGVEGYPTIKWHPAGNRSDFELYNAERSEEAIIDFVNEKSGSLRLPGGGLKPEAGRWAQLDDIARKFFSSPVEQWNDLVKEGEAVVDGLKNNTWFDRVAGQQYIKVFKKLASVGSLDYLKTESSRISRLISGSNLNPINLSRMSINKNVIDSFKSEKDTVAESVSTYWDKFVSASGDAASYVGKKVEDLTGAASNTAEDLKKKGSKVAEDVQAKVKEQAKKVKEAVTDEKTEL